MGTVVAFVLARLDERERAARAATPGPWHHDPRKLWLHGEAFERYDLSKGEEFVGYGEPSPFRGCVAATGPADDRQSMADAAFIAGNDPVVVLADIAVKRKILDLYQLDHDDAGRPVCLGGYGEAYWDVVCLLASEFDQHPDYDPAWQPA